MAFIGRKKELNRLMDLHKKQNPNLVVIKGRRRIGKSALITHFATTHSQSKLWSLAGLAPQAGMSAQTQRDNFAQQIALQLKLPPFTFYDWSDAFEYLSLHLNSSDIILLDEISWMGELDPTFIPKLKAWWDKQSLSIMLVLCGSISTWIEKNILNSTAFFGRINLTINLEALSITESCELLQASGFKGSDYDVFKLLSVLGGVPWYLEQASSGKTADNIIKQLCFEKNGLLVLEFDRIFHDLFGKGAMYKKILYSLKDGIKTLSEIRKDINFSESGTLSKLVENLITAGFIKMQNLWSFKTKNPLKQSLYRICDPYMRFYLRLIEPQRNKIDSDHFQNMSISQLSGFDAHIGLQLEQLLLQNRALLLNAIGIEPSDIVADGPYRQFKTTTKSGCQIDYLIQTSTKNLFICEFKFKLREVGIDIISEVGSKIKALKTPRGLGVIPVLFHISGVSSSVATDEYFYKIIDISNFIK